MNEEQAKYVELSELLLETHKRDFHQRSAYSAVRVNLINGIMKESRDYAQPCVVSAKKEVCRTGPSCTNYIVVTLALSVQQMFHSSHLCQVKTCK